MSVIASGSSPPASSTSFRPFCPGCAQQRHPGPQEQRRFVAGLGELLIDDGAAVAAAVGDAGVPPTFLYLVM